MRDAEVRQQDADLQADLEMAIGLIEGVQRALEGRAGPSKCGECAKTHYEDWDAFQNAQGLTAALTRMRKAHYDLSDERRERGS